jgi:uncharacterized protein (DUF2384 family)
MRTKYSIPRQITPREQRKPAIVPTVFYYIVQAGETIWSGERGALDWLFARKYRVGKRQPDSLILRVKTRKNETEYFYNL